MLVVVVVVVVEIKTTDLFQRRVFFIVHTNTHTHTHMRHADYNDVFYLFTQKHKHICDMQTTTTKRKSDT